MAAERPTEGYGQPWNSRTAHYFVGGRSLCGRWMLDTGLTPAQEWGAGSDYCAACARKFLARTARDAREAPGEF